MSVKTLWCRKVRCHLEAWVHHRIDWLEDWLLRIQSEKSRGKVGAERTEYVGQEWKWSKQRGQEKEYDYPPAQTHTRFSIQSWLQIGQIKNRKKLSADSTTLLRVESGLCVFIDFCWWQPSGITWLAFQDGAEDPRTHPASASAPSSRHVVIDAARMLTTAMEWSAAAAPACSACDRKQQEMSAWLTDR